MLTRRRFMIASTGAVFAVAGCRLPGSAPDPGARQDWRVGFDRSGSALSDSGFYRGQATALVAHLRTRDATLAGAAITGDTVAEAEWTIRGDFTIPSGKTAKAVEDAHGKEAAKATQQIRALLGSDSGQSGSDLLGFLQIAAEAGGTRIVLFSDGYHRDEQWDAYERPLDTAAVKQLVRNLRRAYALDLAGARVAFVGPGRSNSETVDGKPITRALQNGVANFWHEYVGASKGELVHYRSEFAPL